MAGRPALPVNAFVAQVLKAVNDGMPVSGFYFNKVMKMGLVDVEYKKLNPGRGRPSLVRVLTPKGRSRFALIRANEARKAS